MIPMHPFIAIALAAMLAGGGLTLTILLTSMELPFGLAASFYGILLSAIVFVPVSLLTGKRYCF